MAKEKDGIYEGETFVGRLEMSYYVTAEQPLNSEKVRKREGQEKHLEECNNNKCQLPRYPCILGRPLAVPSLINTLGACPNLFITPFSSC